MSTKTIEKKLNVLSREVASLRSLVIRVVIEKVNDPEGQYKPKFVKEILKAAKEKNSYEYAGRGSLLKQLEQRR